MATAAAQKTMELEGALGAFQLPDVLRFLAMGRMNGALTLTQDTRGIELFIKEGRIVGTASPERHLKLGQLLVYSGHVGRRDVEEALDAQRIGRADRMFGEVLIERKLISQEQLAQVLRLQMEEEIWELLTWTQGSFKFEHGDASTIEALSHILVTIEIEPLLEEGARRVEQWQTVMRTLGKPRDIYRVRPDLAVMPDFKLTPATWRVLSLINGRHSVEVLIFLSGIGKFETLCALESLVSLQLIEVAPQAGSEVEANAKRFAQAVLPGSVAAPRPAAASDTPSPSENDSRTESAGGLRGLFGMRKRSAEPDLLISSRAGQPLAAGSSFLTSVGFACDLINRMIARLCDEPAMDSTASQLLETLWNDVGLRFPRADLVTVTEGWLNSDAFDKFVRLAGGLQPSLVGCHEESMAALASIGQHTARLARQRLAGKAEGLLKGTVQPYFGDGVKITHPSDFSPRGWTMQWLDQQGGDR